MIFLQRDGSFPAAPTDSVMTRTVEGIINFWNSAAEELYGWKKEEVIGKVSHELLKTEFPKPLQEIDSELINKGRWKGKLVHSTREGGRVVVESQWILDDTNDRGSVVEINAPCPNRETDPEADPKIPSQKRKQVLFGSQPMPRENRVRVRVSAYIGLVALAAGWVFYVLYGHQIIEDTYNGRAIIPFLNRLMEGRGLTRLENYYQAADKLMLLGTFWLVAGYAVVIFLLKRPLGALLAAISFMVTSFPIFCFFELAPSLIQPFGLDAIPYYAYKANFLDDDVLIYREKPFNRIIHENYPREGNAALYGIEEPPVHFEWIMDKDGFRNAHTPESSDIIAIGDSYLEWGNTEADTFVNRLEKNLSGLTVTNLAKSGYGPPQYFEVLNRYGLQYRPTYALLAFFEGNDIKDTQVYLQWKQGQMEKLPPFHKMAHRSFFERYWLALESGVTFVTDTISYWMQLGLNKIAQRHGYAHDIHPELALLHLGNGGAMHKIKFVEQLDTRSPKEMLASHEWRQLKTILRDVRKACDENGISLIVMYIPAAAHIYAEYSTKQSGENWLQMRDEQIHAKNNTEEAMRHVVEELDIEMMSLTPVLEEAARQGKLLYYPLDPHWNPEGTEVAAKYVAETLKSRYISRSTPAN
jgi:PAS domain S-box-containing protein